MRLNDRRTVEYQHGHQYPWMVLWRDGTVMDRHETLHALLRAEFSDTDDPMPDSVLRDMLALSAAVAFRVEVPRG